MTRLPPGFSSALKLNSTKSRHSRLRGSSGGTLLKTLAREPHFTNCRLLRCLLLAPRGRIQRWLLEANAPAAERAPASPFLLGRAQPPSLFCCFSRFRSCAWRWRPAARRRRLWMWKRMLLSSSFPKVSTWICGVGWFRGLRGKAKRESQNKTPPGCTQDPRLAGEILSPFPPESGSELRFEGTGSGAVPKFAASSLGQRLSRRRLGVVRKSPAQIRPEGLPRSVFRFC